MSSVVQRLDRMPDHWLAGLPGDSKGGSPHGPASATTDVSTEGHDAVERAVARGLSGLQLATIPDIRVTVPAAEQEAAALSDMEFIRRMRALVIWAEPGRSVTQTGAMHRRDTVRWMSHFGLTITDEFQPPSMWDVRGIGQPWDIAIETGMLSLTTNKVRPGPTATVFESDDRVGQILLGRSIVNVLLLHTISRSPFVAGGTPSASTILLRLIASFCHPEGKNLGFLRESEDRLTLALRDGDAADQAAVLLCSALLRELRALDQFGLLTDVDGAARVPAGLRPAVVAAIAGPGTPLTLDHHRSSVPVVIDR